MQWLMTPKRKSEAPAKGELSNGQNSLKGKGDAQGGSELPVLAGMQALLRSRHEAKDSVKGRPLDQQHLQHRSLSEMQCSPQRVTLSRRDPGI